MAPDGKSLITAVGSYDSAVWLHDKDGDHQISSEGSASTPSFSADGRSLYFTVDNGQSHHRELWRKDLGSGAQEKLLPGYSVDRYTISHDGAKVAFSVRDRDRITIWIAPTDRSSSPVRLSSNTNDDSPLFLPNGDLAFRSVEKGRNFAYRMKSDGTSREKITNDVILDLLSVSPDGRWLIATSAPSDLKEGFATRAIPVSGGLPIPLCTHYCEVTWDNSGRFLYLHGAPISEHSYILPVVHDTGLPKLPDAGFVSAEDVERAKPLAQVPWVVESAISSSTYAYTRGNTRRNLYRIQLQ